MKTENKNSRVVLVVIGIIAALAVGIAIGVFLVNGATACGTGDSNFFDLMRARNFGASAFDSNWSNAYTVSPFNIQVVRESQDLGALTLAEYLIFNCGYTEEDVDVYFSDENFSQIILADYDNPQETGRCRAKDGTRLYQFSAQFAGQDYLLSQWAKPDGDKRVVGFFMVFPVENSTAMLEYANKIFPTLPTCP